MGQRQTQHHSPTEDDRVKTALRNLLKPIASTVDRVRPPAPGITVLLYHRVGAGTRSEVDLPVAEFDRQIGELAAAGRIISLDDALTRLRSPAAPNPGEPNPVVITFDDGTWDFTKNAVPVLEAHDAPATLYLATKATENGQPFWGDDGPALTWDALAAAAETGLITVGSHTHSHVLLDRLPSDQIATELDTSIQLIEERLGVRAEHFAYPKAIAPSDDAAQEVRARFRSAALAGTQPNHPGAADPFRLARSPVQVSDGMRFFRNKANGGMRLEDQARELLNRRRYVGASS